MTNRTIVIDMRDIPRTVRIRLGDVLHDKFGFNDRYQSTSNLQSLLNKYFSSVSLERKNFLIIGINSSHTNYMVRMGIDNRHIVTSISRFININNRKIQKYL